MSGCHFLQNRKRLRCYMYAVTVVKKKIDILAAFLSILSARRAFFSTPGLYSCRTNMGRTACTQAGFRTLRSRSLTHVAAGVYFDVDP
jgi:hypothetical protein